MAALAILCNVFCLHGFNLKGAVKFLRVISLSGYGRSWIMVWVAFAFVVSFYGFPVDFGWVFYGGRLLSFFLRVSLGEFVCVSFPYVFWVVWDGLFLSWVVSCGGYFKTLVCIRKRMDVVF